MSGQQEQSKRKNGGSLARGIFFSMLALALVPLLIMALQGQHCARQAVVQLEYAHLQSILSAKEALLESWVTERESDLKLSCFMSCGYDGCAGLANHMVPSHFDAIRGNLDLFEMDKPLYESLAVYDADWHRVGQKAGSSHQHDADLLDEDFKTRLSTGTGIVASATHTHPDHHVGLHMGYPLRDGDGKGLGYIVVNVDLEDTLNTILRNRTGLGASGKLYLLADGAYLTCPEEGRGIIGEPADVPPEILEPQTNRVVTYPDIGGTTVLGSSTRIPRFDWVLVAEEAETEALGWLPILWRRAVLTGLVAFLVVLVLATRFSRKLADPLRALAQTARRIAGGSHHERVGALRGSEAQDVGHAFNEMLDALAQAQQKVVHSASLAAIGELSASVVHEMRNPLSSIKLNLQALAKKVEGDPAYAELAAIATTQALRLERMLTELLQFGKPIELNLSDVSFQALADEAGTGLGAVVATKQIHLRIEDHLGGRPLHVDREQMRRALENLVKNAVEASPEEGEVLVEARVMDEHQSVAEIRVRDAGPGVPAAILPKLFQPFVTTRDAGTGLGLANVKKIVELHEGEVHAENLSGGGALFVLRLPLRMTAE